MAAFSYPAYAETSLISGSDIPFLGGDAMPQARASCKVVVRGSFDVSWADYVGEMLVDVEVKEGKIQTTTLYGQPIDLSAFLGTLHMLIDLGFPVIAFEYHQADVIDTALGNSADYARR